MQLQNVSNRENWNVLRVELLMFCCIQCLHHICSLLGFFDFFKEMAEESLHELSRPNVCL